MPSALDRLLASPSALRLRRSIVNASEWPAACSAATTWCFSMASRRGYSANRRVSPQRMWRKWHDAAEGIVHRDQVRQMLETRVSHNGQRVNDEDASWAITLAQQERLKRLDGVKSIWEICRQCEYRLPTMETPDADFLWATFIKHPQLVKNVIAHAGETLQATGRIYTRLYDLIMSYWLPRDATAALDYHHRMLVTLSLRKLPLRALARTGRSTFDTPAYEALLDIYRNSNERDVYDEVVPALISKGDVAFARRWHSLCTFRRDLPSESVASHPVIRIFTVEASAISNVSPSFGSSKAPRTSEQSKPLHGRYNQELMRRLLGRDTAPVRFEDAFCARMFATRTFPPASIIQGLALVGVNEIGPQAVLAMAFRTQPIEELPLRFEELRTAGIALQGCVFSLAIEKFAAEQKWQLVRSLLESDQHPDVFGDADVQRVLLEHYLDKQDFVQAQRTLAILTLFHNEPSSSSWNLLLQVYVNQSATEEITQVLQDMRTAGVMVTLESILAIKTLLRGRQRGRKPQVSTRGKFDDLRFVTRVYINILESGTGAISPVAWREIIRRFGMTGRLKELRRLLYWLLCWYAPRSSTQFTDLPKSSFLDVAMAKQRAAHPERSHYFHFPGMISQYSSPLHPIRQLFRPSLQQGLIVWGFRAGILPHAHLEQSMLGATLAKKHYRQSLLRSEILKRKHWSIGLKTLVQLRDMGLYVHYHTVLKALQAQFIVMFGYGRSRKIDNRIVESFNTLSYATYVQDVNKIWGSTLLTEPRLIGSSVLYTQVWHPRARRRTNRRSTVHLRDQVALSWQNAGAEIPSENAGAEIPSENAGAEIPSKRDGPAALEDLQSDFVTQAEGEDSER